MFSLNDFNFYYVILSIVIFTIINWLWYAPAGGGEKRYLFDITQMNIRSRDYSSNRNYVIILIFLGVSFYLFVSQHNFRIHSVILGYIIWCFIPMVSTPINLPNILKNIIQIY